MKVYVWVVPVLALAALLFAFYKARYVLKASAGTERMREIERMILLRIVDTKWMDHIDDMDQLKTGIGLRSLGQQDPARAYANEGFDMFELMLKSICDDMVRFVFGVTLQTNSERRQVIRVGASSKEDVKSAADEAKAEAAERARAAAAMGKKAVPVGKTEIFRTCIANIIYQKYKKEIKMFAWLVVILSLLQNSMRKELCRLMGMLN